MAPPMQAELYPSVARRTGKRYQQRERRSASRRRTRRRSDAGSSKPDPAPRLSSINARASFSRRSSPFAQRRRCTRRPASIVEKRSAKFGSISVKIEQDYKRPPRSSSKRPFWAAREGVVAPEDGRRKRSTMTDSERDRIPPLEVFLQNFMCLPLIAER